MADLKFVVVLDSAEAMKHAQEFEKALQDLKKTTDAGAAPAVRSFGQEFTSKLIPAFTAASLAADAVRKSIGFMKNQFTDAIAAAIESEKVDRALESTLGIVGHAADGTAERIKAYADALMRKTIYDDEAIKSAQALIIQMRGTTSEIDEATKGAIGLASVFQMDLQSAARAVAQGFEGNYRQLGMLIPAIRNAKGEEEKHAAMMEFLAGAYKRATEETGTFGSSLSQLKNSYGELQATIGGFVTKNQGVIDTLNNLRTIIEWIDQKAGGLPSKMPTINLGGPMALASKYQAAIGIIAQAIRWGQEIEAEAAAAREEATDQGLLALGRLSKAYVDFREQALKPIPDQSLAERAKFNLMTLKIAEIIEKKKELNAVPFKLFGDFPPEQAVYQLTKLPPAINRTELAMRSLALASQNTGQAMKKSLDMDEIIDGLYDFSSKAALFFGQVDAIVAQGTANREIAIENEYNRRRDAIEKGVEDEEEKQAAIEKLDEEFEDKRSAARRAAAKQHKLMSYAEAVISTSRAIAEALPNLVLAAIVGALGAVQIAKISQQPIPLAKGAFFKQPTLLPAMGQTYALAEAGAARSGEIVSPVPVMRDVIRAELRAAGGRGEVTINLGGIHISAQRLDDQTIAQAGNKIFREIENQMRLRGRRF